MDEPRQAELDAGEAIASAELPVVGEPDEDPYRRDLAKESRRRAHEEVGLPS